MKSKHLAQKDINCLEVTALNNEYVGHELHPLAKYFNSMLRKLLKEILEEIHFLTVMIKADATMFCHNSELGRNNTGEKLLQGYLQAKDYLIRSLESNTQSWVYAFTNKYFTTGVQSTSCNESKNSTLKCLFDTSNLSLYKLFDTLEERYQEENDYYKFVNWKQLNKFVMLNIIKKQEKQINLSLHYHAIEINFEVILSKEKQEGHNSKICKEKKLLNIDKSDETKSNSEEFLTSYEHIQEKLDTVKPDIGLVEIINIVNYPNVFLLMQVVHILIGSYDIVV
ncbi:9786_t:CDS:2, partial [Scutellospora calospora]